VAAALLDKLVIVGVGLIGGSFALALKRAAAVSTVVGVGRGRSNLDAALRLGIVDRALTLDDDWTAEVGDAQLVLLATPVGQMPDLFAAVAAHITDSTVITDAGSTKQDVVAAARAGLGRAFPRFVPAHPIAGTEQSGAAAAFATLFRHRSVILAPLSETSADAVNLVRECWQRCEAVVQTLDPVRHDAIFAAVSHLPHALAFAEMAEIAARSDGDELLAHAGTGFRDLTRLASSSPEMWRDIFLANRAALRSEIAAFRNALAQMDSLLADGDADALNAWLSGARDARNAWLAARSSDPDA